MRTQVTKLNPEKQVGPFTSGGFARSGQEALLPPFHPQCGTFPPAMRHLSTRNAAPEHALKAFRPSLGGLKACRPRPKAT